MQSFLLDLRYAVRRLLQSPGFSLVAVLTLALGIGVTTALFSAVDGLLLRPLPLHDPERLIEVAPRSESSISFQSFSYPQYLELRGEERTLAGLAAAGPYEFSLRAGEQAEVVEGRFVSHDYFQVLGVRPAAGRFFLPEEDQPGAATVAILSHDLWRRHFGGDPQVIGHTVALKGMPFTVVGVAPRGFATERVGAAAPQLWVPLASFRLFEPRTDLAEGGRFFLALTGRLRAGVSAAQAQAALSPRVQNPPPNQPVPVKLAGVTVRPLDPISSDMQERVSGYLLLLVVATTLVLLLAGINVAGMLLARGATRRREIGIRLALGAGRARLVRQLLTESLLLFVLGGAGGVLLALWLTAVLGAVPWPVPVQLRLGIDLRVLGFALLLSLLTGAGFGLAPALQASRPELVPALTSGGRATGEPRSRLRGLLVVLQIALSLVLLVGAGLFLRALQRAWSIDPGFNADGVAVATFDLELHGYDEAAGREFYRQLLERTTALPNVESASLAMGAPFGSSGRMMSVEIPGREPPAGEPFLFHRFNVVSADYFSTLEIPVRSGRAFTEADREGAPEVAIVNRAMAERYWPGEEAVGKQFSEGTIIGVVGDTREGSLRAEPEPVVYVPAASRYSSAMTLHLRTRGNPAAAFASLREEVRALDPALPALSITPLTRLIGASLLPQRMGAVLVGAFGLFGMLLSALGLYGVLAFAVTQRRREIGIRMALGADRGAVLRHFVRQGLMLALTGLGLGLGGALAATRIVASLLYGVSPSDPLTFAAVTALLVVVALLASYLPARRATRVDPMVALRAE